MIDLDIVERLRRIPIPADEELLEAANVIESLRKENNKLLNEHRIAMRLLKENTETLENIISERDKWKDIAYKHMPSAD